MSRVALASLACLGVFAAGCTKIPPEPLHIDRGKLTVYNQTPDDWTDVEIWLNRYFRVAVPSIAARSRFEVPLNAFVSGYAQRFDQRHTLIGSLRLAAKQPDGRPVELELRPAPSGLAVLGGKK